MTPVEALKLALDKEVEAAELYRKLAIEHSAIKDLLTELMNEEFKHKKMIEKRLCEITR